MAETRIAVLGLGYVGLPLAIALARKFDTVGFDISAARVEELQAGHDRTREVSDGDLAGSSLRLSADPASLADATVYIVTVPTPVNDENLPDLGAVLGASAMLGAHLKPGDIVVYESTVYPGVTEELCGPALEEASGLRCGTDFFLGYSPERINPGDKQHTLERIVKVVAGQTPEVGDRLVAIYGAIITAGIHRAPDIRTAEAAKAIENAQRDINIAFVNEVAMISQKIGISAHDVLAAAGTKWNFLGFTPGLVGGHCIGVDPYYLAHKAQVSGHNPEVILAGRRINDGMGRFIAGAVHERLETPGRILVLGLTFKENVPDLRNSKVIDVIRGLEALGHAVTVHDAHADPEEARAIYDIALAGSLDALEGFDALVGAVPHGAYRDLATDDFARLVRPGGLVADIKGMWRTVDLPDDRRRWTL